MTHTNGIGNSAVSSNLVDRMDRAHTEKQSKAPSAQTSSAIATQDGAKLSSAGSVLATAATSTEDVRTERVAALKVAVDAGTYSVSSTAVADTLLKSMLE